MKKIIIAFLLVIFSTLETFAMFAMFGLMTKDNVKNELSLLRAENKGEMNAVKMQNQGDISALKAKVDKLEIKMDANVQAVAGFNNDMKKISAGRDMNTTTTNDTGLMKKVIAGLCGIVTGILGLFSTVVTLLIRKIFHLMENIIDEKQKSKEEYKSVVLREVSTKPTRGD